MTRRQFTTVLLLIALVAGGIAYLGVTGRSADRADQRTDDQLAEANAEVLEQIQADVDQAEETTELLADAGQQLATAYRCIFVLILIDPDDRAALTDEQIGDLCAIPPDEVAQLRNP